MAIPSNLAGDMSSHSPATRVDPPTTHIDLLERPIFAALATVRPDGWPLSNPTWFLWEPEEGVVKLTHTTVRHRYRNIQLEPRVSLSIADPDNPYRYLQVRGVVDHIERDPEGAFYQLLQQRYRGYATEVKDRDVRVVLIVRPVAFRAEHPEPSSSSVAP